MIIKGQARGRFRQLAAHLLNARENESIRLHECRGTVAQSVEGALAEMEALGARARSRHPLYHASISPDPRQPFTDGQFTRAVDVLEAKLGFSGQPRIVVLHRKHGREHAHVVWSRIGRDGRAIPDGWNYARHEEAAREMEELFGHARVQGVHSDGGSRPARTPEEYELRQASRSGIDLKSVEENLRATWESSADGQAFREKIEAAGFRLVRGDRRGFVVLDRAGEAHSLARRLGLRTTNLTPKLDDSLLASLPDVRAGRALQRRGTKSPDMHRLMLRTFSIATGPSLRDVCLLSARSRTYNADRASIAAEFAATIAAACEDGPRSEIAARIRRLRDEEAAALAALKRQVQGTRSYAGKTYRNAAREVTLRRATRRLQKQAASHIKPY